MTYVDLNPVRAELAEWIEEIRDTSIRDRLLEDLPVTGAVRSRRPSGEMRRQDQDSGHTPRSGFRTHATPVPHAAGQDRT